jgi:rhamnulokinase
MKHFLAIDLGAESGRAILGTLADGKLALEELHRFPNTPVRVATGLYWDTFRLFHEIQQGLAVAGRERHLELDGIGVDTWGVDYGLFGVDDELIANPRHYRDERNDGMMEKTFDTVPRAEIFGETGIQFMQLNSLYQLYAAKLAGSPGLANAKTLLFMPDLFNYWLTGTMKAERTIASTSQFYDPVRRTWAAGLLSKLGLSESILPELVDPGTRLGNLSPWLAEWAGLKETPVFASAGHDTACAVAAVPGEGDDWCYISSGTWSLMGVEIDEPIINDQSLALNYTNEIGVGGKVRLLKNIAGLWLLQECKRSWAAEGKDYSYDELTKLAAEARPHLAKLDPDAFLHTGNMPRKIAEWCAEHGQAVPQTTGEFCRTILESLAERYRQVLENLQTLTGRRINTIHIVGGGSRNMLLNRLVAEATGRRVIAGPVEATAAGNILVQAIGSGALRDLDEARAVVRASFDVTEVK